MKTLAKVLLCAAILALVMVLLLQKRTGSPHPAQKENAASVATPSRAVPPVASVSEALEEQPAATETAAPAPAPLNESEATRRMYAAHAPLRVPEVADPDSETNRQIMQTMVQKALQHKASTSPANNPAAPQP